MPLNINPAQTKFSTIVSEAPKNLAKNNEAIRGGRKDGVTQLYQHGDKPHGGDNKFVNSSFGKFVGSTPLLGKIVKVDPETIKQKQAAREAKEQQGASWIRSSIDNEHGAGFGARVFQHVLQNRGEDLAKGVLKQDLTTIENAIHTLQTRDAQAVELVSIATDLSKSPAVRDQAATKFRNDVMSMSVEEREDLLTGNPQLIDVLGTLRKPTGAPVFSVAQLSQIAHDQFRRETPGESAQSFFRGNSVATKLLGRIALDLDHGALRDLGGRMKDIIQETTSQVAPLIDHQGQEIPNPQAINHILTAIDASLAQHVNGNDVRAFLTAVAAGIDRGNPPQGAMTSQELVRNAIWLRSLCPAIVNAFPSGSSEGKVARQVSAVLQKMLTGKAYEAEGFGASHNVLYNDGLNELLARDSGFRAFQATIQG